MATACGRSDGSRASHDGAGRAGLDASHAANTIPSSRAERVELADRLAAQAARSDGASVKELHARAAELREKAFRSQHRSVDALEAVEQLRAIERSGHAPCSARLKRILIEAEQAARPERAYAELYALRLDPEAGACRARLDQALQALLPYRPPANVLQELERRHAARPEPFPSAAASVSGSEPASSDQDATVITQVERYGAADAARVVVFVTRPTRFEVGETSSPSRVYVDIEGASFTTAAGFGSSGLVQGIRLGQRRGATRVTLELSAAATPRVFYLPEPYRLVIDVSKAESPDAPSARRIRRAVLDPGHGGHDPGAIGPSGLREKDVVLDIAHRAAPLLARELGISTLLTRDADQFVPLDERTARANAFRGDLFISIHCNASEDSAARGAMAFVLDRSHAEHGPVEPHSLANRTAARENSGSSQAAVELVNTLSQLTDPANLRGSLRLAELLTRSTQASFAERYRDVPALPVQRAGFFVLAGARMPAVLFETSFISNAAGEAHLSSPDFRQKLADAIVNSVRAYREGL